MSDNFDWRTEEDDEWPGSLPETKRRSTRRRWFWPLAIVVMLLAAGAVVYWQVQERLATAEAAIVDDVVSSFHLIREAEEQGDIELFRNLLSGTDLGWANAQQDLFKQERLFDLSAFGLGEGPQNTTDIEVTLAPRLNSAEVTSLATYADPGGAAGSADVHLRQTAVYRRGDRWVWSPPRDDFWGPAVSFEEGYLQVSYPARDEGLVLRLARDLNALVEQICATDKHLACPDNPKLSLSFSSDPAILVDINEDFAAQGIFGSRFGRRVGPDGALPVTFPTPSLLGVPDDEASYQALLRGYGAHLAVMLAGRYVDPACCGNESRVRAAIRNMLFDLTLIAWPPATDTADVAAAGSPDEKQVALLCSAGFERRQKLIILDVARGEWQEQPLPADLLSVKAVPGDDGVLLLALSAGEDGVHNQVWRQSAQGSQLLFDLPLSEAESEEVSWEIHESQGLLVVEAPDIVRGYSRYFTLNLSQCQNGDCLETPNSTVSRPVWSPDGSQLMVRAYGLLWWRVGSSMVPIADGTAPFWVDEEIYGYARSFGNEQALVLVDTVQDREEEVILTTADLREALNRAESGSEPGSGPGSEPARGRSRNRLLIGRVLAGPPSGGSDTIGSQWLILAFEIDREGGVNQARFFAFDPVSDDVQVVEHAGRLLSYNVAPGGERLAIGGFLEEDGHWALTVFDRNVAEPVTLSLPAGGSADAAPSYSWSEDEAWLMILEQGILTLLQPETGAVKNVSTPEPGCVQAAWYGSTGES